VTPKSFTSSSHFIILPLRLKEIFSFLVFFPKNTKNENISFNLNGNIIKCEDEVKLLGVTIDFELNFNTHIANICKKASTERDIFIFSIFSNCYRLKFVWICFYLVFCKGTTISLEGGLCFFSKKIFPSFRKKISDNTRVRIFIFFVGQSTKFFFPNSTLGYMTKL
jgi:hypothetical protein